jgi:DNA replication initiation complex subunit (GINS family)
LRRVLEDLKGVSKSSPEKMREYERVEQFSRDIADCRLKKIITLASTPGQKGQILRNLTAEELTLYEELEKIIDEWRREIL